MGNKPIILNWICSTKCVKSIGLDIHKKVGDFISRSDIEKLKNEYVNRDLFDYESKTNELLTVGIKKMKKEKKSFDFHKFKAEILGKDYTDTDKTRNLIGFVYRYAENKNLFKTAQGIYTLLEAFKNNVRIYL